MAQRSPPTLTTLVLVTALSIMTLNMFSPSLAGIARDFEASYGLVSLSIGGYLLVTALLQLALGTLSDRYGRRPIMLAGLTIFVLASIGCTFAPNIEIFLICRLFQGAVITGAALSKAVLSDILPKEEATSKMGYLNMAVALAPMLAPGIGGILEELFSWRANFVAFTVMGMALLILVWHDMGETNQSRSASFRAQFALYPELLRARRFWGYAICLGSALTGFYTFTTGAALVARDVFGLPPMVVGFAMGSITMGFFITSFIAGRLGDRMSLASLMLAGRALAASGLALGILLYLIGLQSPLLFFASTIFVGLGNGLTLPPASIGVMSVRPELAGSATGLSGALAFGLGALVTSMTGALLTAENGAWLLLTILFGTAALGLFAARDVQRMERKRAA